MAGPVAGGAGGRDGYLDERRAELAHLVTDENGACARQAEAFHIGVALANLKYFAQQARTYEFERDLSEWAEPEVALARSTG